MLQSLRWHRRANNEEAEIAHWPGQFDQAKVVRRQFLIACGDRATLFEPTETLFDGTPPAIGDLIVGSWVSALPLAGPTTWGNDELDASVSQPVSNTLDIIPTIGCQAVRPSPPTGPCVRDIRLRDQGFKLGRFKRLPWNDACVKRSTTTIADHMQLVMKPLW